MHDFLSVLPTLSMPMAARQPHLPRNCCLQMVPRKWFMFVERYGAGESFWTRRLPTGGQIFPDRIVR